MSKPEPGKPNGVAISTGNCIEVTVTHNAATGRTETTTRSYLANPEDVAKLYSDKPLRRQAIRRLS